MWNKTGCEYTEQGKNVTNDKSARKLRYNHGRFDYRLSI